MSRSEGFSRSAFVLAGGRSSRMGTDKARIEIGGSTLLERMVKLVGQVCPTVAIVGEGPGFADYGVVVEDLYPGCGPLGGIQAALAQSGSELNLIVAVDMPFVSVELLRFLFDVAGKTEAIVTVPRSSGYQPLCAVYRKSFAAIAERALRAGRFKIDALFTGADIRVIHEDELRAAGFEDAVFANVNTPEDLRSARASLLRT